MSNNKIAMAALLTIAVACIAPLALKAVAQNEKISGDTTATPVVLNLDDFNGIDVVWHHGKLHLRPDQIAKFAYRLSLTCNPECHE